MEDMINVAKFATGTYRTEKQIKSYIQSLQPTVKAVRVEMEIYMGLSNAFGREQIKVEQSTEYPQGIVRAIEVIY